MTKAAALGSALVGAVVAVVVMLAAGAAGGGDTKTVVQQVPLAAPNAKPQSGALTAREIYKRDAPGVVFVVAQIGNPQPGPFGELDRGESTGSGFVIGKGGSIVTNAHVVQGARAVTVRFGDERAVRAKVAGTDPSTDLALLLVDPDGLDLRPLELGSSRDVEVGDPTVAIGNPFGLDRTLTTGVVSAKQRHIPSLLESFQIDDVIQTDAAINPGNSGGPLIDATGRVIGVNSQIETGGSGRGNVGIGFAVPIDTAKRVIPQLRATGRVDRAYLGVSTSSQAPLDGRPPDGARVVEVQASSPAGRAGLRPGDVIRQVGDAEVTSSDELGDAIERRKPGEKVTIVVERDGDERTVEVELGTRPGLSGTR